MEYRHQYYDAMRGGGVKYCGVCGDVARSYHFGGLCCDSCKAFFRRSVHNDNYLHFQCCHQGNCVISMSNRKSCQYCRMKLCFSIGMEKSWVMTEDERKALMKARAEKKLLKQKQAELAASSSFPGQHSSSSSSSSSSSLSGTSRCTGAEEGGGIDSYVPQVERMADYMEPLEIKEIESIVTKYLHAYQHVPYRTELRYSDNDRPGAQIMEMFGTLIRRFAYYARLMADFSGLPFTDQSILLKGSALEMCLLRSALSFDQHANRWPNVNMAMYRNSPTLKLENVSQLTSSRLFQMHVDFISSVQQMGVDEPTIMLLVLIVLFTPERGGLECGEWIERCQSHYTSLLEHYMNWRFGPVRSRGMFSKILTKLSDLRELADTHNHHNLRLGEEEVASIQNQLAALKLNPYREVKVVPEASDYPEASGGSAEATNLSAKNFSADCLSAASFPDNAGGADGAGSNRTSHLAAPASSSANQTAQFLQAVQHSVNQVANAPHFGMEWIKPDYHFDCYGGSAAAHPPAPEIDLTEEEMTNLYVALEEFTSNGPPLDHPQPSQLLLHRNPTDNSSSAIP